MEDQGGHREEAGLEPEIGVERLRLVDAHQHVGADADGQGQDQQQQLHVAPGLGDGAELAHWPASQAAVGVGEAAGARGCRRSGSGPAMGHGAVGVAAGAVAGAGVGERREALIRRSNGAGAFEVLHDPLGVVEVTRGHCLPDALLGELGQGIHPDLGYGF